MSISSKNLVLTFVYKGAEAYINHFTNSIKSQKFDNFDIFIIDDYSGLDLSNMKKNNIDVFKVEGNLSIPQVRQLGFEKAVEYGYNNIILADIDDFFSNNRAGLSIEYLDDYDFVFNQLVITNSNGEILQDNFLSKILKINLNEIKINDILDKNFIGFSNSAIKSSTITDIKLPPDIIAVDWYLYTVLLLNSNKYRFLENVHTFYRQTSHNIIGIKHQLNSKFLLKGILVKKKHYLALQKHCINTGKFNYSDIFRYKYNEILELEKRIRNEAFLEKYLNIINTNFQEIYCGWWSEILPLNEWSKYE